MVWDLWFGRGVVVGSGVGVGEKVVGIFWLGIGALPRVLEDGEVSAVGGICMVAFSCL